MKRRMGLPWLVLALLLQLFQGSVGPASLAAPSPSAPPLPPLAVQPSLGVSDLSIAAEPGETSAWTLPPHSLFEVTGKADDSALVPAGFLPSSVQGTGDPGFLMQVSGADAMRESHTFFVPFDDTHLWQLFEGKAACQGRFDLPCGPLVSKVFVTSGADNTAYFYDHHEDGYEPDPTNPVQGSTERGLLDAGATVVFASEIDPTAIGPDNLYYDGRDRITIVGEDANVVRLANPSSYSTNGRCPGRADSSGWLAAAWEVLEVDDWGTEYHATVGEDLDFGLGGDDHDYASLEIMAAEDGTTVSYAGQAPVTLNAGETYFVPGDPVGANGVASTDDITSTSPIQVQMVTGDCRDRVSGHGYTLQPRHAWDNAYLAPVPGFGLPAGGGEGEQVDTDIYVHNPDPVRTIEVTVTSGALPPETLSIPPNSTVSVLYEAWWPDLSESNQGTYLSSDDEFWGVSVIDTATVDGNNNDWDWGYSLVPESELSSQLVVGYAPGKPDEGPDGYPTDNGNLAFVVAVTDTVIYVDLDQDGRPDPFDIDGDGNVGGQDLWGVPEWDECVSAFGIPMQAGQVLRVGDPFDRNLQGARIFTRGLGEHIAAAWGQDPIRADRVSYLDLGYTLLPLRVPRVFKTDGLGLGAGYLPGDEVTYTILVENNGMATMADVVLMDTLPYTYTNLLSTAQVTTPPPTGSVEYYDGAQWLTTPTSDTQRLRVAWQDMDPQQVVTITLRVGVHTAIPASVGEVCNHALVTSANTDPVDYEICRPVYRPQLSIDKAVSPAQVYPGETVTYTVVVSNSGDGLGLPTVISDLLPSGVEYVPGTLNLTWPAPRVDIYTRTVTQTNVFHGHYADDFDGAPGETTGYGGSDGSFPWTGDWVEVNDDGEPGTGTVQVLVDEANALSTPAHALLGAPGGAAAGLERTLDLSQFLLPALRFYPAGSAGIDGDDAYQVTASGTELLSETYPDTYCVHELSLSGYAGQSDVTLGWLASTGMDAGDFYRLDEVSVYDKQPERVSQRVLANEVVTYALRSLSGGDPLAYDALSGQMVFTESLALPAGGTFTLTYQALVGAEPPIGGSMWVTNTSCVTTTDWLEGVPALPCDDAPIYVLQQADLEITKSDQPDLYAVHGEVLTYTLAYRNLGAEPVQDVVISDTLPNEVVYGGIVAQPPGWSAPPIYDPGPPATLTWTAPSLAPGAEGQFVYTVTVSSEYVGTITNQVCISTTTPEAGYDNNCDLEETTLTPQVADLAIVKRDDPEPGVPGGLLTYTLVYINNGPFDAQEVYITDTFPVGITFVEVVQQPPGWVGPDTSAGPPVELIWYRPTLAASASGQIVYTVLADEDVPSRIENRACISSATADSFEENNCDLEPTAVQLLYLNAMRLSDAVLLQWETAWEVDSYGFVLLRRADDPQAEVEEIAFVPAQGQGGGGAAYRYLDDGPETGLESGTSYTYWLVEVDTSGRRTTFGSAVSASDSEFLYDIYLPIFWCN